MGREIGGTHWVGDGGGHLPSCVLEMVGSRKVTKVDGWSVFQVKIPNVLTSRLKLCHAIVSPIQIQTYIVNELKKNRETVFLLRNQGI